jgi:hypothetical protein
VVWRVALFVILGVWFILAAGRLVRHVARKSWEDRDDVLIDVGTTISPVLAVVLIIAFH